MIDILKAYLKLFFRRGVYTSFAQFGEDLIIRPFVSQRNGIYVDVGCYHPTLYSNTYRLYTQGWSGLVIDPNPHFKTLFQYLRPRDTFVLSGVGVASEGMYHMFSDGAYNTFNADLIEPYKKRTTFLKSIPMKIRPLGEICQDLPRIDVLTVDVEGLDLEVLQSFDWRIYPTIIIVETKPDSNVATFLRGKGYTLVGQTKLNCIFKSPDSV